MAKRFETLMSVGFVAVLLAVPASAAEPGKRFADCSAVWKAFPNGIARSAYSAGEAQRRGNLLPQVRRVEFNENRRLAKADVVCERAVPDSPPSPPSYFNVTAIGAVAGLTAWWAIPETLGKSPVTYDIYLDGVLFSADNGLITSRNGGKDIKGLSPSTSYTVGIVAKNTAGSSPMLTASQTTKSAGELDHPGRYPVVYSITGTASSVDVTLQNDTSGTSQYSDVVNPSYTVWMRPGAFVYVSAQNQGDKGEVTCTITSQGRVIAKSTSSGAYAIASCSGSL